MKTPKDALTALKRALPVIATECCAVLGSEQHYQAMVYHALRVHGQVPLEQLGMNVKIWIPRPKTTLFRQLDRRKAEGYRGGFEPIPDVVIFAEGIEADWRRRNRDNTLRQMLLALESKASERDKGRLSPGEVLKDLRKLHALGQEIAHRAPASIPQLAMLVIDSARDANERMTESALDLVRGEAQDLDIALFYVAAPSELVAVVPSQKRPVHP
ncbi:hypothetical protein J7643_03905 [bacterium]|nr:hypothetical protein [bacterium]